MDNYPLNNSIQARRLKIMVDVLIALTLVICAGLIYLTIAGYGSVRLNVPSNVSIKINDHKITSRHLKIRPGSYQILVSSPLIMPYQGTLNVSLFKTTIYKPSLENRSANAIASSVVGSAGPSGSPYLTFVRWFDNSTWVVGLASPGIFLALHYNTQSQWGVGFYNSPGYPDNLTALPASVATYIEQLEAQHAGDG